MHFMSKKNNLRQTQIVTLSDYNRKQIEDINQDKQNMIKEYQQKKEGNFDLNISFQQLFYRITNTTNTKRTIIRANEKGFRRNEGIRSIRFFEEKSFCFHFYFLRKFINNKMMKFDVYNMK
jgi:hypothetical protein